MKEKMKDIEVFLTDIFEAKKKGKGLMERWLSRFETYYDRKFGSNWKSEEKEFWEKFGYWL